MKGTPKFDTLTILLIKSDMTKLPHSLEAEAAFLDSTTGATHGWTKGSSSFWSEQTMNHFKELKKSMEKDMCKLHFSYLVDEEEKKTGLVITGLAEHLSDPTPSV